MEMLKTKDQNAVLKNILTDLTGNGLSVKVNAPSSVELTVYRQVSSKRLIVNLLNDQMAEENLSVYGIEVSVKSAKPKKVICADNGKEVDYEYKDGYVNLNIEKLDIYNMYVIYEEEI